MYDSNRYTVFGLLKRMGVEVIDMGVVRDEPAALEAAFRTAAAQADAIITSGGVSMGEADHTKAMMKQLGDVAFWRIAMRPGRPMAVGRISEAGKSSVLFGLPGNPVAVMVTFLAFVRPALQRLMGSDATAPVLLQATEPGAAAQEARTHRIPARHRQPCRRRFTLGPHHRQPGLGRAELHGGGQRPDRLAPLLRATLPLAMRWT